MSPSLFIVNPFSMQLSIVFILSAVIVSFAHLAGARVIELIQVPFISYISWTLAEVLIHCRSLVKLILAENRVADFGLETYLERTDLWAGPSAGVNNNTTGINSSTGLVHVWWGCVIPRTGGSPSWDSYVSE